MPDNSERLSAMKLRLKEVQRSRARKEAEIEHLHKQIDEGMSMLKSKYGANNIEEAGAKLVELQQRIDSELTRLEKQLEASH